MTYQIDQSGKIEDTAKDTVLALAKKDHSYTIRILARENRKLQQYFKDQREPKLFIYKTFAAGVFILLNTFNMEISSVTIDREYIGHERLISDMLRKLFKIFGIGNRITISFGLIG